MQTRGVIAAAVVLALASCNLDARGDDTGVVFMVEKMLALTDSGDPITCYHRSGLSTNTLALKLLSKAFAREEATARKLVLVQLMCEHALSRSRQPPEWTGGGYAITNSLVVEFLLGAMNDKDHVVRERAMNYLCNVDVRCLKGREKEIVKRIDEDGPGNPRIITYFLGRLGPEGVEYLRGATNNNRFVGWYIEGALAKAGDEDAKQWVKQEFECASEERKWIRLNDMVYFGQEVSGMSIAKLLRSGMGNESSNNWNTLRFAALEGLKRMYPEEKTLQFDRRRLSEEDYIQAEKWAERRFHISWTNERPTFIPLPQP